MRLILLLMVFILPACGGGGGAGNSESSAMPSPTSTASRVTTDRPDDTQDYQLHLVYVVPSDGDDRFLDADGTLATSIEAWQRWLENETLGSRIRIDTYLGEPDITYLRLKRTNADIASYGANIREQIEYGLLANGFTKPNKIYLFYYEGGGAQTPACASAGHPPDLPANSVGLYLQAQPSGAPPCNSNEFASSAETPGYLEFTGIHEVLHALGFVASCAPNLTAESHTSDSNTDLMYAGTEPWYPSALDINNDDYFSTGNSTGNSGCLDLKNSAFLDPLPLSAEPPPGWPYTELTSSACANESTMASIGGGLNSTIEFVNATDSVVYVYWLNFAGARQLSATLEPEEGYQTASYLGHNWVATDSSNNCLGIYSVDAAHGFAIAR